MRRKKGLVIGTLLLALASTPFVCKKLEEPTTVEIIEREIADIAVPYIISSVNNSTATEESRDVLVSDNSVLYAAIQARDRVGHKIFFSDTGKAVVNGERVQKPFTDGWEVPVFRWDESRYGPIEIEWHEIRSEKGFYNNTIPSQSKISYREVKTGSGWSLRPGLGTHRFVLRVKYHGREFGSRDARSDAVGGYRTIVREADDVPGQMTAWADLPYIYGSTSGQVESYIGADCADLITGAVRRMGQKGFPYTYSLGFERLGKAVFRGYINMQGEFLDEKKRTVKNLPIKRGDLLIYKEPQRHVAVFHLDLRQNGDPIEVVHGYDEKGVHVARLYSGATPESYSFSKKLSGIFWNETKGMRPVDNTRLDRITVVRLPYYSNTRK